VRAKDLQVSLTLLPAIGDAHKYFNIWRIRFDAQAEAARLAPARAHLEAEETARTKAAVAPVECTKSTMPVDGDVNMDEETVEESVSVAPKQKIVEVCISVVHVGFNANLRFD